MKKLNIASILILASCIFVFSSCRKEAKTPELNTPSANLNANKTIAELLAIHRVAYKVDTIKDDIIVQGIVIANDESGNFYKKFIIQDTTAAIEIEVDKTSFYTEYKVGQKVFIKCKDLCIGDYYGLPTLGYTYIDTFNNIRSVGRIPDVIFKKHFFKDGLPGNAPSPKIMTLAQIKSVALVSLPALNLPYPSFTSTLIKLDSVQFINADKDKSWANTTVDPTNRYIKFGNDSIVVRTSSYANFSYSKTPKVKVSLTGIISFYKRDWQFYIRDLNDVAIK